MILLIVSYSSTDKMGLLDLLVPGEFYMHWIKGTRLNANDGNYGE